MKRVVSLAALGMMTLGVAVALVALRGDQNEAQAAPAAATTVEGTIHDNSLTAVPSSVPAGDVQFVVSNAGTTSHEFVVIKTDLAPDALPVVGGTVDESASSLQVIDTIAPFAAGTQQTLTVNLAAGNYVLICNLPGHYQGGVRTAFTVTEATATSTPTPAATATATPAATATATPAATATPTPAATATPAPTATPAATATATPTPTSTAAPTTATPAAPPPSGAGGLDGDSGPPVGVWVGMAGAAALLALAAVSCSRAGARPAAASESGRGGSRAAPTWVNRWRQADASAAGPVRSLSPDSPPHRGAPRRRHCTTRCGSRGWTRLAAP